MPPRDVYAGVKSPSMASSVYKICPRAEWVDAQQPGVLRPSEADARDGYVHLSAFDQVQRTLRKHFAGQKDLVLLEVPIEGLPADSLRWEDAGEGELFPHFYGELRVSFVSAVQPL